ncbi:hypothetical protein [Mesorhizobium sp. YR577]|uniref:hypothetical protein n=1 Tax=Mesorhizobium sp. YR577 TaxID=1884373 RepID=UPI001FCD29D1|nr:hypothetical protein [Mesorhizobium sp. YR577]
MIRANPHYFRSLLSAATNRSHIATFAMLLAAGHVAGCVSNQPEANSVRNIGKTAPADLQLMCASAAATPLGVDSSAVLPVSSSEVDAQTFQVVVEAKGARANCVIDTSGKVISVQKV